jgi:hypothetical protein
MGTRAAVSHARTLSERRLAGLTTEPTARGIPGRDLAAGFTEMSWASETAQTIGVFCPTDDAAAVTRGSPVVGSYPGEARAHVARDAVRPGHPGVG